MTTEHHDFEYSQSFLDDNIVPGCSCGWIGRAVEDVPTAQEAWENHCDVVFMEATGG